METAKGPRAFLFTLSEPGMNGKASAGMSLRGTTPQKNGMKHANRAVN